MNFPILTLRPASCTLQGEILSRVQSTIKGNLTPDGFAPICRPSSHRITSYAVLAVLWTAYNIRRIPHKCILSSAQEYLSRESSSNLGMCISLHNFTPTANEIAIISGQDRASVDPHLHFVNTARICLFEREQNQNKNNEKK